MANDVKQIFSARLALLLQKRGSSTRLADALGVSRAAVSWYVTGNSFPTVENLVLIAKHFDISLDYLLGLTDAPTKRSEEEYFTGFNAGFSSAMKEMRATLDRMGFDDEEE